MKVNKNSLWLFCEMVKCIKSVDNESLSPIAACQKIIIVDSETHLTAVCQIISHMFYTMPFTSWCLNTEIKYCFNNVVIPPL